LVSSVLFRSVQQVDESIQMLLGIFAAHGVLPLDFKPAHNVADLLLQHLDQLEQEALNEGGIQQLLAEHFARVYKIAMPGLSAAYLNGASSNLGTPYNSPATSV
jgi:hypothetical protein